MRSGMTILRGGLRAVIRAQLRFSCGLKSGGELPHSKKDALIFLWFVGSGLAALNFLQVVLCQLVLGIELQGAL
jgi:hypothetical protein